MALLGPRLVGAGLLGLAILLVISALGIASGGGYSVIGPATVPLVVTMGLLVLAALFLIRTTILPDTDLAALVADEEAVTDWATVGLAGAALVAYPFALEGLGYIVATAIFLPVAARILGSRSTVRDAIAGVAIAVLVYFGFTELLGVRLPAGILGPLL